MMPLERLPYILWTDDSGQSQILRPNVQENESIELSSEVTEHPVETGVNITDHVRLLPDKVTVAWYFNDAVLRADLLDNTRSQPIAKEIKVPAPSISLFSITGLATGAIGLLTPKEKLIALYYPAPTKPRYVQAYDIIQDIRAQGILVDVKTTTALFREMAIESVSFLRGSAEGDGARVSIGLKKVRFVQSDITIAIPEPKTPRSKPPASSGKGVTTVPPPQESILSKTGGALASFFNPVSGQ